MNRGKSISTYENRDGAGGIETAAAGIYTKNTATSPDALSTYIYIYTLPDTPVVFHLSCSEEEEQEDTSPAEIHCSSHSVHGIIMITALSAKLCNFF